MLVQICLRIGAFAFLLHVIHCQNHDKRLVCYYDATSENIQIPLIYIEKALPHCTHLVFASAHLDPKTYQLWTKQAYFKLERLKRQYPHLKIYLSVGGDSDENDKNNPSKYLHLLESDKATQQKFINNSIEILNFYGFHGLDLAFPLPKNKPREDNSLMMLWNNIWGDTNRLAYREYYTKFVADLKDAFKQENLDLTMTVLPNVNSSIYYDIYKIQKNFEFINLFAFDFNTAERNPHEADHSAPLYYQPDQGCLRYANADFQVNHWLDNGCPADKLNLGIATYGRAWKLTMESGLTGQPIVTDTAGCGGFDNAIIHTSSQISWPEICTHLPRRRGGSHRRRAGPHKRRRLSIHSRSSPYGNYAFHEADKSNQNGIWISYDDPDFASTKTDYAIRKELGGIALFDLAHDDFQGICQSTEYPILQAVRSTLRIAAFPSIERFIDCNDLSLGCVSVSF